MLCERRLWGDQNNTRPEWEVGGKYYRLTKPSLSPQTPWETQEFSLSGLDESDAKSQSTVPEVAGHMKTLILECDVPR